MAQPAALTRDPINTAEEQIKDLSLRLTVEVRANNMFMESRSYHTILITF